MRSIMSTAANGDEQRYTLPHTNASLPKPVVVSDYQRIERAEVVRAARLHIGGVDVGRIEDWGRGGGAGPSITNEHRPVWEELLTGAQDWARGPMGEEYLAETLVTEAQLQELIKDTTHTRRRYASRYFTEHQFGGDATKVLRYVDAGELEFPRAVNMTPERVPLMFSQVDLPERAVRADVYVRGRWVQFHPSTD
jgi:hypothetical protein